MHPLHSSPVNWYKWAMSKNGTNPITLEQIVDSLDCTIVHGGDNLDISIYTVTAGDLMSEVLVVDEENMVIVTSLNTDQVIRTADIVAAAGVVLVNGKTPGKGMVTLAESTGITLLSTPLSLFDACVRLGELRRG